MSAPYEIRTNDNGKTKKQSMAELKLRRLTELNQRLQEDLNRRRIPVSEAAMEYVLVTLLCRRCLLTTLGSLIAFTDKEPKVQFEPVSKHPLYFLADFTAQDFMVPSRWGTIDKREDPYAPQQSNGCCSVM